MDFRRDRLKWNGWGWADKQFDLKGREQALLEFFRRNLSMDDLPDTPSITLEEVPLPASRLSDGQLATLRTLTAEDRVCTDRYERVFHAVGRSYHDLVRVRTGALPNTPDAVVYPLSDDEVQGLLELAEREGFALVPFGGGSSVVGGVEAAGGPTHRAVITVDMSRMDKLLHVDEEALTATAQAGIYGPSLEAALQERGFTLGHYPQSFEFSSLGGWIAHRGAGQQSNRYGTAAEWTVGARVLTPAGALQLHPFPHSAAGPELRSVVAGSEGVLGFITEATVKLHPTPPSKDYRGYMYADFATGLKVIRELVQEGVDLAMARLSDNDETWFLGQFKSIGKPESWADRATDAAFSLAGLGERPCLLLVGLEGTAASVAANRVSLARIAMGNGGLPVGSRPGKGWYKTRFELPYMRDELMDHGIGVDTLETSTSWSNMVRLHEVVTETLRACIPANTPRWGGKPQVLAHVSHAYTDGASLYFTFLFPIRMDDPVGQWRGIKRAVTDAIVANGGTISHHHGVGTDHRDWMTAEKSPVGVRMIRATKTALDPRGTMNPGKLLPDL